jgi:hypothetical protein
VRKREKKAERLACTEPGRSITPSIDTKDMISTTLGGIGPLTSVAARSTIAMPRLAPVSWPGGNS